MKRFKKIFIEITNICNLSCGFCPETKRAKEHMDIETFTHILDEIKPFTDYIYLHVKGEPLLNPNLSKFFEITNQKDLKVNITTNGSLLEKNKKILFDNPSLRQVNISLHSLSNNRNVNIEEFIVNILNIAKGLSSQGKFISLRLWNFTSDNTKNNLINKEILKSIEDYFNLPYKIEDKASPNKSIKIFNNIYLSQEYEFQWPSLNTTELGIKGFCYGLRNHLGILVDGTVVPCCLDGEGVINLGNIKNKNFSDIINGERAINLFNSFSKRIAIEPLCRRCGYRTKMDK